MLHTPAGEGRIFIRVNSFKPQQKIREAEAAANTTFLSVLFCFVFFAAGPNVLMIAGFLVFLMSVAVSVVLYQSFRVDIVLLYRDLFQAYSVKDGE